jgi:Leu/Phe-tRNA-protein transferase
LSQIFYLSKKELNSKEILDNFIYPNKDVNYYISDDFSPEFYIDLAKKGFITVSDFLDDGNQYLFPEIQFEYAVLHFDNLHISKKVQKLLKNDDEYYFSINKCFDDVLSFINSYHDNSWLRGKYLDLLNDLKNYDSDEFELLSVELRSKKDDLLIAGEIGYIISKTYTSLSGFTNKKYNNYGKLQMVLLAKYLEQNSFEFWNMGHPYMQYKLDLGAKILSRKSFLKIWLKNQKK